MGLLSKMERSFLANGEASIAVVLEFRMRSIDCHQVNESDDVNRFGSEDLDSHIG